MASYQLGWVYRHSPYRGAVLSVHLALGDIANDAHGNRIYCSTRWLAKKSRTSVGATSEAVQRLVAEGYLRAVGHPSGQQVAEYEFLMPEVPVVFDGQATVQPVNSQKEASVQSEGRSVHSDESHLLLNTKNTIRARARSSSSKQAVGGWEDEFADLWNVYPRKLNKAGALRSYIATLRRLGPEWREQLKLAVDNYAAEQAGKDPQFMLYASTFFGPSERWRDYLPAQLSDEEQLAIATKVWRQFRGLGKWRLESFDQWCWESPSLHGYVDPLDSGTLDG